MAVTALATMHAAVTTDPIVIDAGGHAASGGTYQLESSSIGGICGTASVSTYSLMGGYPPQLDTSAPTDAPLVTSVSGSPVSGSRLTATGTLTVNVTFANVVTWDTSGSPANPTIVLSASGQTITGVYQSGRGTGSLTFTATIPALVAHSQLTVSGFSASPLITNATSVAMVNQTTASSWSLVTLPTWTILHSPNHAPVVANPIATQSWNSGGARTFTFTGQSDPNPVFSDPDADDVPPSFALTYTASGMPAGVTFTPATRTFATTNAALVGSGLYPITITATDACGASVSTVFTLSIRVVTITITDWYQFYDGNPKAITVATSPTGISYQVTDQQNNATIAVTTVNASGQRSTTGTLPSALGAYGVSVVVTTNSFIATGDTSGTMAIIQAGSATTAPGGSGGACGMGAVVGLLLAAFTLFAIRRSTPLG